MEGGGKKKEKEKLIVIEIIEKKARRRKFIKEMDGRGGEYILIQKFDYLCI